MILAFTGAGISKDSGIETFMERPDIRDCLYRDFANQNPQKYREVVKNLKHQIDLAQPNDAHFALVQYNVKIITMNIDGLHQKAGSDPLCLHGTLPSEEELEICDTLYEKPVLYGDSAPNYSKAIDLVYQLTPNDTFLVIGASLATAISYQLQQIAMAKGAEIISIQQNAKEEVRKVLEYLQGEKKC